MASETAQLTHCPTCGVKLHRTDLSLCAYCAAPLRMGASSAPPDDETQRLLQKIQSHPGYAAAMEWAPIEPRVEALAARFKTLGALTVGLALLCFAAELVLRAGEGSAKPVLMFVFAGLMLLGVVLIHTAYRIRWRERLRSMLRRPARVLDRRSQTELTDALGATTYFFQLRFADGSEGEFRFPGRGTMYEPPTVGASGVAYTRGSDMIEFKRF